MTLRRIYLANAWTTGALGLALCVWGIASKDFLSGPALYGASFLALGLIVDKVGRAGDAHFLELAAVRFQGAYLVAAIPLFREAGRGSNTNQLWLAMMGLMVLMAQAFNFEEFLDPMRSQSKKAAKIRADWQEQIRTDAVQQERNRMAQDLHDSVKQQLFSIQTNLAAAQARWETDEPAVQEAIAQARNAAREASAEIGAMLDQLQPSPLESLGLVEALRRQCEALAHRSGAHVQVRVRDVPPLDAATQTAVYRIGQEALANIGRHARARNVELELDSTEAGESVLQIHDDGQGWMPGSTSGGLGLCDMRTRAVRIGGILTVDSTPGHGCTVRLRFRRSAYAMEQRTRHSGAMWRNWGIAAGFGAMLVYTWHDGQPAMGWMWGSMVIAFAAAAVYHTRKYLHWKGQAA